ncbi:CHAT domain-containing protein [Lacibacter luteus]|uniref:CHAT domain-containing protein n=1 Tax=Lacibacter luteus TaxID=2508719 RepID=A0A4Q1CGF8_9BACT|nr:CHAT domain-containing protein [Lacibacter luteus]RXK59238.1 CHAT domain-containing protein [Lacibacter luteus]
MLRRLLPFSSVVFLFLFFSGDDEPQQKAKWIEVYQPKDQLQAYLEKLYDLTDEQPFYLSNKADSLEQTLWRKPKAKEEQTAYLDFVLNIAYHLLQQGQIQASTRWYEKGLKYQQQQKVVYEAEEFIIKPLGNNYVRLGNYDKAIALQQSAIEQATAEQKFNLLPSLYSNQAITYYWLGNYDATQTACNKGLHFISQQPTATGLLYNVKADAFYAAAKTDSAYFYNQKALTFFRSADATDADASWMVSALQLSAKLLYDQQQWSYALKKLQNAEKILEQSYPDSRQRDKAKLKIETGKLFLQLQQPDSSIQQLKEGLQYFNSNNGYYPDHTVTGLYAVLAKAFAQQQPDSAAHYYQLAVANDYYCNQLITVSTNSLQSSNTTSSSEEAIVFFEEQYRRTGKQELLQQLLWLIELSKGRKLLNEQNRSRQWQADSSNSLQQQLFAELRNDYLLLAETNDAAKKTFISERIRKQELQLGLQENRFAQLLEQPSLQQFQQKLKEVTEKADFISYAIVNSNIYLLHTKDGKVDCKLLPLVTVKQQTDSLLQTYFSPTSSAYNNDPSAYFQSSNEVRKQLLPFSINHKPLIISADGWLHNLPFEALSIDDKQQFLAEQTAVSYVYSFLQYVQDVKQSIEKLPLTVYSFSKEQNGFAALPNSIVEAKQLSKQFKANSYEATVTDANAFVQSMQSGAVLHIAAHAVADSTQQPYLVLKQKFYLGQLQYVVTAAPLVVLTACETAAGKIQNGEGVTSIGRAFISKGVKAVVASRWPVDDAVAPLFVQSFYTSLQKQHSPVTALQDARKEYLQNATSLAQKNPLLWSGFCYIGVDQQLQLQTSFFSWYWLLLLFIPIIFLIQRKWKRKISA